MISRSSQRVALVTNIVAPYRTPTLRELARHVHLRVFYSAEGEAALPWMLCARPFDNEIVGGLAISVRGRKIYLSPRLLRRLLAFKPTVVAIGGFSMPTLYALAYCKTQGAKLVIINEGTAHSEQAVGLFRRLVRRTVLGRAGACIAVSTSAAKQFERLGVPPASCVVAPYALDVQERPIRDHNDSQGPPRLLVVGQLIKRKGLEGLVAAFQRLRTRCEASLTIVGSGPLETDLRAQISRLGLDDSVTLHGFVDQPALPVVYAEHDLFVFPTLNDPFGVVLLEAMAGGLPVIGSCLAGATPDYVVPGRNGWVFDPRSPGALDDALDVALACRDRWSEFGADARATVERRSPAYAAEQILRALSWATHPA